MSDTVIQVRDLGKQYRLGARTRFDQTLPEALSEKARGVFEWICRPRDICRQRANNEDFWALRHVSFDVKHGEVVGIVGRNGAGKSTLLKILSQITDPTEGYAVVDGRVASLLEVGTGFHPELTGRENIYLNGSILGMSNREIKLKFDEIVAFSGVERFLDTPIKRYSSGMTMRLAFSVAAHLEPEILVIDEVLAVGDVAFQKKCLGKMDEVARCGRTVLFVSHNMSAVRRLCTRGILLSGGQVEAAGHIEEVTNQYYQTVNHGVHTPHIDLADHSNKHGDGELDVLSVELVNPYANSFAVPWDQPVRLKIRVRVNKPVRNVTFAVGCRTPDYVTVFNVYSTNTLHSDRLDLTETGEREIAVTINHNLNAGIYHLVVGVSSGQRVYYHNEMAAQLEILDVGDREYHDRRRGLIHCQSQWSV